MKSYRDYLGFSDCHLNQRGTSVFILLSRKAVLSEFSVKFLGLPSEKAYIQALLLHRFKASKYKYFLH